MAAISHILEVVASSMDMLSRLGRLSLIERSLDDHGCECVCFETPHYQSQACQLSTPVLLLRPMRDGRYPRMMKNHQDQGRASLEKYSCRKMTFPRFRGHPVKPQPSSLRTQPGNSSRVWSDDVADYRTLRCIQRCPVLLRPVYGTDDDR